MTRNDAATGASYAAPMQSTTTRKEHTMKTTITTGYIRLGLIVATAIPLATSLGWFHSGG